MSITSLVDYRQAITATQLWADALARIVGWLGLAEQLRTALWRTHARERAAQLAGWCERLAAREAGRQGILPEEALIERLDRDFAIDPDHCEYGCHCHS